MTVQSRVETLVALMVDEKAVGTAVSTAGSKDFSKVDMKVA